MKKTHKSNHSNPKHKQDKIEDSDNLSLNSTEEKQWAENTENEDKSLFDWEAADSFSVKKSPVWYIVLTAITLLVSSGIYLLTKDKITTAVMLVSGLLIGIYGGKKPKVFKYQMSNFGFKINDRYYKFSSYRSFAIIQHGNGRSIVLTPLGRLTPYMYIYFNKDVEDKLISKLNEVLPKEDRHSDIIDGLFRKIGY